MPDKLKINEKLGLIEIESYGIVSTDDINKSIEKSQKIAEKYGIKKLLVDTTKQEKMPGTVSVFSIFSNFPRHLTLALVANKGQRTLNETLFAENVAVNRGIRMKIFYNRKDAVDWLDEH